MRNKVRNIASNTGRFQDGNPATGELGTVVTAQWLNEMQDFAQDTFEELKNVLALGNLTPNAAKKNQVAEAISIAIRNVRAVADSNTRSLQNVIPNSKKSNSVASTSSDTVATSYAVKQAYDLARGKQSPATTLAGYGITDAVKLQDLRSYVIDNTPFDDATPAQLPRGTFLGLSSRAALTSQPANGWKLVSKGWHNESGKYACVRLGIVGNKFYYQTAESWNRWGTPIELAIASDFIGSIAFFATSSAPNGWLKANGAAVSRTTYAALFARIGTTFGAGDERTTFNLPDLRGEFIRGWDDGRNVDSLRGFGSQQTDAIRNISGVFSAVHTGYGLADEPSGAFSIKSTYNPQSAAGTSHQWGRNYQFDASRVVATANENRPRNIALLACIKY